MKFLSSQEHMLVQKQNRIRDKKHLRFVASLACCVSGALDVQAAHISEGRNSMGMKSGDDNVLPLSVAEHAHQHRLGEKNYWSYYGGITRARKLASKLYEVTGNYEAANLLIGEFQLGFR